MPVSNESAATRKTPRQQTEKATGRVACWAISSSEATAGRGLYRAIRWKRCLARSLAMA